MTNLKLIQTAEIEATKGSATIAKSDLFHYLDSDFKNWGTDIKGNNTEKQEIGVCELIKNSTFKQIFSDPDKMCLTQGQILKFVETHRDCLPPQGYATFFLFKPAEQFFVALVHWGGARRLEVFVDRLAYDFVWDADDRYRVVLPQLALKDLDSDPSTLGHSVSCPHCNKKIKLII